MFKLLIKAKGKLAIAEAMCTNDSDKITFLMKDQAQEEPAFPRTDFSRDVFIAGLFRMITDRSDGSIGHRTTLTKALESLSYMPMIKNNLVEAMQTPGILYLAVSEEKFDVAQLLLENGADRKAMCHVKELLGEAKEFDEFSKEFGKLRLMSQYNTKATQFSAYDVMHVKVKSLAGKAIPAPCRNIIKLMYNLQTNEQVDEVILTLHRNKIGGFNHESVMQRYATARVDSPISVDSKSDSAIVVYSSPEAERLQSADVRKRQYTPDEIEDKRKKAKEIRERRSSIEERLSTEFRSASAVYAEQVGVLDELGTMLEKQHSELEHLREELRAKTPTMLGVFSSASRSPLRPTNGFTVAGILKGQFEPEPSSASFMQSL